MLRAAIQIYLYLISIVCLFMHSKCILKITIHFGFVCSLRDLTPYMTIIYEKTHLLADFVATSSQTVVE